MKAEIISKIIMLIGIMFLLTSCGQEPTIIQMQEPKEPEETVAIEEMPTQAVELQVQRVFVHVCGAVNNPGVYELDGDGRVFEAIELAGGFTAEAYQLSVNMANLVSDGQQIVVLTQEEAVDMPSPEEVASVQSEVSNLININTADISRLQELNGIGAAKAQEILQYREKYGRFGSIEDIRNVNGIGEKLYERIKENITVD